MTWTSLAFAVILALTTWTSGTPDVAPPPGALNPAVTQATIDQTICVRGWTRTIRPPESYTSALKRRQIQERHLPGEPADYEEDHWIPLELGGAPYDPANLWPEPWAEARLKDDAEGRLNRAVCAGRITLRYAQHPIQDPTIWGNIP